MGGETAPTQSIELSRAPGRFGFNQLKGARDGFDCEDSMDALERLLKHWGCRNSITSGDKVLVPSAVLEQLVLLAFGRGAFSEKEYVERHPDVAEAVCSKEFMNGLHHFIWEGIKENRGLSAVEVDPGRYLELNPDLAEVDGLTSPAALAEHWLSIGWLEGRLHKR